MTARNEFYKQITGALAGAKFPINTPQELLAAFPNGADTTCQADGVKMTAGEAGKLLKPGDFPFKSAGQVANTILERAGL
ncbi:MTH865 family protein [Methanocella arvoryzae]|uniref:MTH865-like family protein n=1 Tax=Methanocella arvoryzae (strain DSM 22066 / NBRC 105507 / MRE50) TaxID=351160 RepID=Q0W2T0_METAR|nr:MTH865 family protein [Methanocella arvoryzae]CAJ37313.1 conserved hypothetical protein [Methanocella arvoryzae MRE50]